MYFTFWLVLLICSVAVFMAFPMILRRETRRRFGGSRKVTCPETSEGVTVKLEAGKDATALLGPRVLEISTCSRWPEKKDCPQDCIPEALTQNPPEEFSIRHLGVFIVAMASWGASGALRYSPFARDWMAASGLPEPTFWLRIGQRYPVILGFLGMLLLAYVFTWIMRHTHQAGVVQSLTTAGLLWLGVLGITLPEIVFFVPARVFALDGLAMLIALFIQGLLVGLLVVPKQRQEVAVRA